LDNAAREKLLYEIQQINTLLEDASPLLSICRVREPDFIERSAAALLLHSFYNGIESMLVIIEKSTCTIKIDSPSWHKTILDNSFMKTEKRPAIFSASLKERLQEYMLFRHFVRHSYGFQIVWDKMKALVYNLNEFWHAIKGDITLYIEISL
jgi:hypothetical protein